MKNLFIVCSLVVLLVASALFCVFANKGEEKTTYFRVHIRANSNEDIDQGVKYAVKESISNYLTPLLSEVKSYNKAIEVVKNNLNVIEEIADSVLKINNFTYGAKVSVRKEEFPVRTYENLTLEAGIYDALIVELGSATGDNWWCVVFPPLCFVGNSNDSNKINYKSFVYELINK